VHARDSASIGIEYLAKTRFLSLILYTFKILRRVYGTECWKFGFVHPPYGVVYLCTVEVVLNRDALNVLDHDTVYAIEQAHCFLLDARFAAILQSIDPRSKLAVNPIEFRVPITGTGMPNIFNGLQKDVKVRLGNCLASSVEE